MEKHITLKLTEARQKLKYSQSEMAEKSGIQRSDISRLENGEKKFLPLTLLNFLHSSGFDLNSLFDPNSNSIQQLSGNISKGVGEKTQNNNVVLNNTENESFNIIFHEIKGLIALLSDKKYKELEKLIGKNYKEFKDKTGKLQKVVDRLAADGYGTEEKEDMSQPKEDESIISEG